MKKNILVISAIFSLLQATPASGFAQEATNTTALEAPPQIISVSAIKYPELKPYKVMLRALDAYQEHKALAKNAAFHFNLVLKNPSITLDNLTLHIVSARADDPVTPIPLSPDGSFTLPRLPEAIDANADLVVNTKKNWVSWRPIVRSPNLPDNVQRMGDLRLACEITWEIEKDDLSFFARNLFRLAGGLCHSSKIGVTFEVVKPLAEVFLVDGELREKLPTRKGSKTYTPPLYDTKWSNETRIEFHYSDVANP